MGYLISLLGLSRTRLGILRSPILITLARRAPKLSHCVWSDKLKCTSTMRICVPAGREGVQISMSYHERAAPGVANYIVMLI